MDKTCLQVSGRHEKGISELIPEEFGKRRNRLLHTIDTFENIVRKGIIADDTLCSGPNNIFKNSYKTFSIHYINIAIMIIHYL